MTIRDNFPWNRLPRLEQTFSPGTNVLAWNRLHRLEQTNFLAWNRLPRLEQTSSPGTATGEGSVCARNAVSQGPLRLKLSSLFFFSERPHRATQKAGHIWGKILSCLSRVSPKSSRPWGGWHRPSPGIKVRCPLGQTPLGGHRP